MLHRVCAALVVSALLAAPAWAAGGGAKAGKDAGSYVDLAQMALPVVVDGKIKNYVFVHMRLKPAGGADVAKLRANEPHYRDALIRGAHRVSFSPAGDWTSVDEGKLEGFLLTEARRISGPKSFAAAELLVQTPRKRTGMPQARAKAH